MDTRTKEEKVKQHIAVIKCMVELLEKGTSAENLETLKIIESAVKRLSTLYKEEKTK